MHLIIFIWVLRVNKNDSKEFYIFFGYNIAEHVAEAYSITRQEQDEFALQSQLKCQQAVSLEHFDTEIEPIIISTTKRINEFVFKYFLSFVILSR
jgi:acetyl-CoA acetyltransferase